LRRKYRICLSVENVQKMTEIECIIIYTGWQALLFLGTFEVVMAVSIKTGVALDDTPCLLVNEWIPRDASFHTYYILSSFLRIILHFRPCHWVMSLDLPAGLTVSSSSARFPHHSHDLASERI